VDRNGSNLVSCQRGAAPKIVVSEARVNKNPASSVENVGVGSNKFPIPITCPNWDQVYIYLKTFYLNLINIFFNF